MSLSAGKTFAEKFCCKRGIDVARYQNAVLWRCLYPHALLLKPFLQLFNSDYFLADLDFIGGVGQLRRTSDFAAEASEFNYHPKNRGILRHMLRMRVSARRLRRLVAEVMDEGPEAPNGGPQP
jgi:hypothetical protein